MVFYFSSILFQPGDDFAPRTKLCACIIISVGTKYRRGGGGLSTCIFFPRTLLRQKCLDFYLRVGILPRNIFLTSSIRILTTTTTTEMLSVPIIRDNYIFQAGFLGGAWWGRDRALDHATIYAAIMLLIQFLYYTSRKNKTNCIWPSSTWLLYARTSYYVVDDWQEDENGIYMCLVHRLWAEFEFHRRDCGLSIQLGLFTQKTRWVPAIMLGYKPVFEISERTRVLCTVLLYNNKKHNASL